MPPKKSPPPLPEFEDETTLFSLSVEFFEAATVLSKTPPTRIGYALVTYYLAGHAAELTLKSLLYKCGDTIEVLTKQYRHDLKLLVNRARLKGLPHGVPTEHILSFSAAYTRKRAEYRSKRPQMLPPLDLLLQEIKALQSHVFNHVADIIR